MLNGTGSVGLAFIYWSLGFLMALAGLSVYLELASYFPNRSGSEAVYLEQAYPRPKHFFPMAFAVQSVLLSFSSSNAIGTSTNTPFPILLADKPQFYHDTSGELLERRHRRGN